MKEDLKVPVEKLRRVFDPDDLPFEQSTEVEPAEGFIGQERAMQALSVGLEIDNPEYNIFITDRTGISRKSVLLRYLEDFAQKQKEASGGAVDLRDFCYVFNFENNGRPRILCFAKGEGRKLKKEVAKFLKESKKEIPLILKSKEFYTPRQALMDKLQETNKNNFDKVQSQIEEEDCLIVQPSSGFVVLPASKKNPGEAMSPQERRNFPEEKKKDLDKRVKILQNNLDKVTESMMEAQRITQQKIEDLEKEYVGHFLKSLFKKLLRKHAAYPEAIEYLEGLKEYILDHIDLFRENGNGSNPGEDPFLPFVVNLIVDNSETEDIPVVFEENPNFGNLFGRMDKSFVQGFMLTDHTKIKAGSLLRADGGYLVLKALDLLVNPGVWQKLERTIRYGFLKIEEPMGYLGFAQTNQVPDQIPVRLKVIIVGDPMIYRLLVQHDPEFQAIFKIKAELNSEMPANKESEAAYAAFISFCCQKEDLRRQRTGLLPFDKTAVAKIVEYGFRLSDKQSKLSTEFNRIKELIVEADYWAEKSGSDAVKAEHVRKALETQKLRVSLTQSKLQELIREGIVLLDTKESVVGQINGLSVYNLGDYSFGMPARITVQTFLGKKGLISIDREVDMTGPIHNKGVHILSGYFGGKYGKDEPISFSASVCFEQSYGGIEGDSASAAELFCLISSLAGKPIKQNIAVTGSVNQKGEIQPIGGVNQKIEGFFDICKERGLTGDQGVVIPHQNVHNLMLSEEVVQACQEGKFWVWAIKNVDEGVEILIEENASSIHKKVEKCLLEMAKKVKKEAPNES